jgi:hypothetical protein
MSVNDIDSPKAFGRWMAEQVAVQLPVVTTLVATSGVGAGGAGLGIISASSAGQKIGELEDERKAAQQTIKDAQKKLVDINVPAEEKEKLQKQIKKATKTLEISDVDMFTTGLVYGGLEFVSEKVSLGILSKGKRAAQSLTRSAREEAKSGVKDYLKEVYRQGRASLGSGFSESGAEFLNQLGQNIVDMTYLDKADVHVFDNTEDALASGYGMGVGMRFTPAMMGLGAKAFIPKSKGEAIRANIDEINQINSALKKYKDGDPDVIKSMEQKIKRLSAKVSADIGASFQNLEGRDPAQIKELTQLDKKANKIMKQVNFTQRADIDPQVKSSLLKDFKSEIDNINARKEELLNSEKQDGSKDQEGKIIIPEQQEIADPETQGEDGAQPSPDRS